MAWSVAFTRTGYTGTGSETLGGDAVWVKVTSWPSYLGSRGTGAQTILYNAGYVALGERISGVKNLGYYEPVRIGPVELFLQAPQHGNRRFGWWLEAGVTIDWECLTWV